MLMFFVETFSSAVHFLYGLIFLWSCLVNSAFWSAVASHEFKCDVKRREGVEIRDQEE